MIELVWGDAAEELGAMSDVDFIFADPPYNISNTRNVANNWNGYTSYKGDWDVVEDYEGFTRRWVGAACSSLRSGGILCISGVFGSLVPAWEELMRQGMKFQSHIVWHKTNPAPTVHHRMLVNANEIVLCFSKGPKWYFNYDVAKELAGRDPHNVMNYPVARRQGGIISKPLKLVSFLVQSFCSPDGLVVDPFIGTGTTAVAAEMTGRRNIGIDISPFALQVAALRCRKLLYEVQIRRGYERARRSARG